MRSFEFICGGDHGAWECQVTAKLTEEEISILKTYAVNREFLDDEPPVEAIYMKVIEGLENQCDDDIDLNNVLIWLPFTIKKELL